MSEATKDIKVSLMLDDVTDLAIAIKALANRAKNAEDALGRERADFAAYRNAEIERNVNTNKHNEESLMKRIAVLEKNERKQTALQEYLAVKSGSIQRMYDRLSGRLANSDKKHLLSERRKIDKAWKKFDAIQKECTE